MRVSHLAPVVLLAACAGAGSGVAVPTPAPESAHVTADELRADLTVLASDSMRGRETGTADALRAARFLAERLQRLGLEPAGDSMFFQRIPLQRERFGPATQVMLRDASGTSSTPLLVGRDVVPLVNLGPGIPPTKLNASGDLVFVSYGITSVAPKRDDFAGARMTGKVVVVVNGAPAGADSAMRNRLEAETAISDRLARILPERPAAVIVLLTGKARALFDQSAPQLERAVAIRTGALELPDDERPLPMILLGIAAPGSPLLPAGWPAADAPRATGQRLTAHLEQIRTPVTGYNVVGMVRGSDRALGQTYVALGAHYDHIGIVPPVAGDSIANGADDDGSGSVTLLALARVLQQQPVKPRRSILFVWHVGEEKGLLGSRWFVEHPTVPIDSIVAQLNADMIGRNAPSLLYTIGPLAAPNHQSRRLGAIVDSVNLAQPVPFAIDRSWDSATHPEHFYERSDHFNYARMGIPIVFFTTGLHDDYHKPSDEVSAIEFDKLARVAGLLLGTARAVGNSASRPH